MRFIDFDRTVKLLLSNLRWLCAGLCSNTNIFVFANTVFVFVFKYIFRFSKVFVFVFKYFSHFHKVFVFVFIFDTKVFGIYKYIFKYSICNNSNAKSICIVTI